MMVLFCSYFVRFLLYLALAECKRADNSTLSINVSAVHPNGRESSFLYDGGSVEITCRQNVKRTRDIELHVASGTANGEFVKLESGNSTWIKRRVPINSGALWTVYQCISGSKKSPNVTIGYALCNPRAVKPKKVCPKPNEFCHIMTTGSAECKGISGTGCLFGHKLSSGKRSDLHVFPKFKAVCTDEHQIQTDQQSGLCYSLSNVSNRPGQFLSLRSCFAHNFSLIICKGGEVCKNHTLILSGWNYIDLAYSFSIYVHFNTVSYGNVSCNAADSANNLIKSNKVPFNSSSTKGNPIVKEIIGFDKQLKQLATPSITDIVCVRTLGTKPLDQFQTNLLLFRSDRDMKYEIIGRTIESTGDHEISKVKVSASVPYGLYVCIAKASKRCAPHGAGSNVSKLAAFVSYRQEEYKRFTFYAGLFASSPKKKYVLIFEEVVNRSVVLELNNSKKATSSTWVIIFAGVALVVAIIVVAVVVVNAIVWTRKSSRPAQGGKANAGMASRTSKSKATSTQPTTTPSVTLPTGS